ncbi:MAG: hypothetical protein QXL16_00125 [Candidatus Micrarchaeaceae archaeon]
MEGPIDQIIRDYNLPPWVKKYAFRYIRKDPANAVKRALSFILTGRKRGLFTGRKAVLPNGIELSSSQVAYICSLFLYGEEMLKNVVEEWSKERYVGDEREYGEHYKKLLEAYEKHIKAMYALLLTVRKTDKKVTYPREVVEVFDYIRGIRENRGRILVIDLIIRYSYAKVFGNAFFKAFFPVSPKLLKQVKKIFEEDAKESSWGEEKAKELLRDKKISKEEVLKITIPLLNLIKNSIDANLELAKRAGLENEIILLRDIAIAAPLHALRENGIDILPDKVASQVISGKLRA